jgi:hypothetical protein
VTGVFLNALLAACHFCLSPSSHEAMKIHHRGCPLKTLSNHSPKVPPLNIIVSLFPLSERNEHMTLRFKILHEFREQTTFKPNSREKRSNSKRQNLNQNKLKTTQTLSPVLSLKRETFLE